MIVLAFEQVSLAYGHVPLLDHVDLQLEKGERVCLVGRNGTGKSTLLRVAAGQAQPDEGDIRHADTLRVAHLEQEVKAAAGSTVFEAVAQGLGEPGRLISAYHDAARRAGGGDGKALHDLADLQQRIEAAHGWDLNRLVETALERLGLPADKPLADCSGGIRRQAMLARALVSDPDLLLLDEPTNHMDIRAIGWLEEFLLDFRGTLLFITHDRTLLRHLATRIIELDRGTLRSFPGDFDNYLRRKSEILAAEEQARAKFDKELQQEEDWIRQGIKARRTRNEGRVRRLEAMRLERNRRLERAGRVNFELDAGDPSGKLVADLRHVSLQFGDHCIIRDFSTRILRGDRVGIIGPNGAGKSTLLKILLGELQPDSGTVVLGARVKVAYFDQQRAGLDLEKSVRDNLSPGSDFVNVRGRRRHVISHLRDFLFPAARVDSPVKSLSGGERNRLLLAALFTRDANMLVLDEPTNDLDVETLELLEELLCDFDGTLLLVSHDRTFLDNVVTSTIAFENDGHVAEYVGGYEDWLRQRPLPGQARVREPRTQKPALERRHQRKLGYREQRELDILPSRIEALEREQQALAERTAEPGFYQQDKAAINTALSRLAELAQELEAAYRRWSELEN